MELIIRIELYVHICQDNDERTAKEEVTRCADNQTTKQKPEEKEGTKPDGFLRQAEQMAKQQKNALSLSTIDNYMTAIRSFKQYLGEDVPIGKLSQQMMKEYERWLRDRNVSLNTVSCYMRSLRSLLQKVSGKRGADVFDGVYTGRVRTGKRAVSETDIARLKALRLKPDSFSCQVRDLFLFSFYALGMPFVDVAFLRKSQIANGQLTYFRHKTGQKVTVSLEPCMQEIIQRYQTGDSPYVFPLIKSSDQDKAYREYQIELNLYNRALKHLAAEAGLDCRLTSYVARHTWASMAFSQNVDLPVISKALGHTNPQTTLVYIKEINDHRLDEANRKILDSI